MTTPQQELARTYVRFGAKVAEIGDLAAARSAFEAAIRHAPAWEEPHFRLGTLKLAAGDPSGAEIAFRATLKLRHSHFGARQNLGVALRLLGRFEEAIEVYRWLTARTPADPAHWRNLSTALSEAWELDAAESAVLRALQLAPGDVGARHGLSLILSRKGNWEGAIDSIRKALRDSAKDPHCHVLLALALLTTGQFEEGWREFEWRNRHGVAAPDLPGTAWTGGPVSGKTLLLFGEQGLGDAIQFSRYATLLAFGNTRRLSEGAAQTRTPSFSPDGRRIVYAIERDGAWSLDEASLPGTRQDTPAFYSAASVQTRTLLKNSHENFQPHYSPDGKELAYLEDRNTLKVMNLASGQSRVVLPARWNYSYSDGDQWYDWSPDGRSLLVTFMDRTRFSQEVGLVDAQGRDALLNLTQSGYEDANPLWTRGGQAMLWFSDRMGLHGPAGSAQQDAFAMFFTREAYDRYRLDPSEYAQVKRQEDEDRKAREEREGREHKTRPPTPDALKLPPPVAIERDRLEDRIVRLTPNSTELKAAAMTPDGETLYFVAKVGEGYELWLDRMRDKVMKKIADLPAGHHDRDDTSIDLRLDAKGENGFVLTGGAIQKFKLPKDNADPKVEPLKFTAEMRLDRAAERAAMFDHVWRQTLEKLYVADMNGVDWAGYRRVYEKFLPFIADNQDFTEMLSEMLGELNVSHTGSGARRLEPGADDTAALGAFFDDADKGAGLRITEVIEGGPLESAHSKIRAGMVIEKIDGIAIAPGAEVDSLLNQKAGKRLALSVLDPSSGARFEQAVKPISQGEQLELLYKRWVKAERERVDRLSGGRLGYVHVRAMDEASYRDAFAEILGRNSAKEALIVDTRFNGGGNLHDALATLLSGKRYLEFVPRGQSFGFEPDHKWTKPSLVVISESNYSDAHLFPWVYRHLGIGKLLGMPVAGTGTAVWWETLQDGEVYFGIPEIGFRDDQGHLMESALIEPDIKVQNDPGVLAAGRDQQIEAAVKALVDPKN